jgi:aspartate/methionine/tyrosine aminotransferase
MVARAYARTLPSVAPAAPVEILGEIYPRFGLRARKRRDTHGMSPDPGHEYLPLLDLGIGGYFDCEPEILSAAMDALAAGQTRYMTLEPLKEAVAAKYREEHGAATTPIDVLLLGGARPGIAIAALAGLDPGDRVIVPDPDYVGLTHMVSAVGAAVVRTPMTRQADGRLVPDLDRIATDAGDGLAAIFLTNPGNPTGHVWSADELHALSTIASRTGAFVVVNEIYDRLVFQDEFTSYAAIGDPDVSIVIGGTAKVYEMTGFGCGWIISSPENIATFEDMQFLVHQAKADAVSQHAALAALTPPVRERAAHRARERLLANARATVDAIDGFEGCRCPMPSATQFAFPWVGGNDLELAVFLKERHGVQVVPGAAWGAMGAGHLRIALANDPHVQQVGLARLCDGIRAHRARRAHRKSPHGAD